jgi:hypothetical protein
VIQQSCVNIDDLGGSFVLLLLLLGVPALEDEDTTFWLVLVYVGKHGDERNWATSSSLSDNSRSPTSYLHTITGAEGKMSSATGARWQNGESSELLFEDPNQIECGME